MTSAAQRTSTTDQLAMARVDTDDPFQVWRELQESIGAHGGPPADGLERDTERGLERGPGHLHSIPSVTPAAPVPSLTASDLRGLADLDDPRLVLSEGYVGPDRRRSGVRRALSRITHVPRRSVFRIDVLMVVAVVAVMVAAGLVLTARPHPVSRNAVAAALPSSPISRLAAVPEVDPVPSTVPVTVATAPVAVAAAPVVDPSSPESMGAAALALVRYPWQSIPGFSIKFLPISDAPSPGFYGNTDFTWGQTGGVSTLYVFPGETVDQLAGITAFEIGHEVDAAYVEPHGGHDQIADILDVHPASWAPECDCAEQGYLSGWYAAAFSDYWSPGVGAWSSLAPEPSGATLDAVRPWLDPSTL